MECILREVHRWIISPWENTDRRSIWTLIVIPYYYYASLHEAINSPVSIAPQIIDNCPISVHKGMKSKSDVWYYLDRWNDRMTSSARRGGLILFWSVVWRQTLEWNAWLPLLYSAIINGNSSVVAERNASNYQPFSVLWWSPYGVRVWANHFVTWSVRACCPHESPRDCRVCVKRGLARITQLSFNV